MLANFFPQQNDGVIHPILTWRSQSVDFPFTWLGYVGSAFGSQFTASF
jgi:hypothetical protein